MLGMLCCSHSISVSSPRLVKLIRNNPSLLSGWPREQEPNRHGTGNRQGRNPNVPVPPQCGQLLERDSRRFPIGSSSMKVLKYRRVAMTRSLKKNHCACGAQSLSKLHSLIHRWLCFLNWQDDMIAFDFFGTSPLPKLGAPVPPKNNFQNYFQGGWPLLYFTSLSADTGK